MKALFLLLLACAIFGSAGYFSYELFVKPKVELKKEKELPPTPPPVDPTIGEFKKCEALASKGQLLEARRALGDFIERFPESTKLEDARNALGDVNSKIFLSPVPAPEKQLYIVKSGDVLNRVASRTKATTELIVRSNNVQGTMLRIGQKLYIPPAAFSLVISRRHSKVTLLNDGHFFKQYPIRQWPPVLLQQKKGVPVAKQMGKVIEKIAWLDGTRVVFSDKGYAAATHWISISIPHCTLFAAPPADADPKTVSKPPSGIAIDPAAAAELAAMLSRGNPVTLE